MMSSGSSSSLSRRGCGSRRLSHDFRQFNAPPWVLSLRHRTLGSGGCNRAWRTVPSPGKEKGVEKRQDPESAGPHARHDSKLDGCRAEIAASGWRVHGHDATHAPPCCEHNCVVVATRCDCKKVCRHLNHTTDSQQADYAPGANVSDSGRHEQTEDSRVRRKKQGYTRALTNTHGHTPRGSQSHHNRSHLGSAKNKTKKHFPHLSGHKHVYRSAGSSVSKQDIIPIVLTMCCFARSPSLAPGSTMRARSADENAAHYESSSTSSHVQLRGRSYIHHVRYITRPRPRVFTSARNNQKKLPVAARKATTPCYEICRAADLDPGDIAQ